VNIGADKAAGRPGVLSGYLLLQGFAVKRFDKVLYVEGSFVVAYRSAGRNKIEIEPYRLSAIEAGLKKAPFTPVKLPAR
jgi:hypothetical protein